MILKQKTISALTLFFLCLVSGCVSGGVIKQVAKVGDFGSLEGKKVVLEGVPRISNIRCTKLKCSDNSFCCNSCGSELVLENSSLTLSSGSGTFIGCRGNSCNMTCTPETGRPYLFRGRVMNTLGGYVMRVEEYEVVED